MRAHTHTLIGSVLTAKFVSKSRVINHVSKAAGKQ